MCAGSKDTNTDLELFYSVAEVTVGHICGSLPIIAVVFKAILHNEKVKSLLSIFRSRFTPKGSGNSGFSAPSDHVDEKLPTIPKGRLYTLKSFIRKVHRSHGATQHSHQSAASESFALDSVDLEYHTHLKNSTSV